MSERIKLVGIAGSLRKDSVSRKLLNFAVNLLPDNVIYETMDITDIPLFNQDMEYPVPAAVKRVREQLAKADGLIIATPEYNAGIPGVLKNVIDWLSRPKEPMGPKPMENKTAYVLGGSAGMSGTITAQEHLRSILSYIGVYVLPSNRATVPSIFSNLDEKGILTLNPVSEQFLKEGLESFVKYTIALKS